MNILVSSCLLGMNCKYNGKNNFNAKVKELENYHHFIAVCPEVLGGLGVPRMPSEILDKKVINCNNIDVTKEFILGANETLSIAIRHHCQLAILKSNSPSCGFGQIYDGSFSSTLVNGNGITADLLYKNGIVILNENNFYENIKKNHLYLSRCNPGSRAFSRCTDRGLCSWKAGTVSIL